ncbi:MAG: hypothetical protein CVT89_05795 [Candidatus Altiarchaeales archaeon HGW-Altiarchaeales-2]|nr:MAG: hypothetical protein CVT89_05795 [Candidatus Altiarchaeales archaeon HGW-Altiarchaeales-2]
MRIRKALDKCKMPHLELEEKQGYFIIRFVNPPVHKIPEIDEYELNERQKKAIGYLKISGQIMTNDCAKINDVSERTALNDMVTKDIIIAVGETNKRVFELRQNFGKNIGETINQNQK